MVHVNQTRETIAGGRRMKKKISFDPSATITICIDIQVAQGKSINEHLAALCSTKN